MSLKKLQDRYLVNLMACRRICFVICYSQPCPVCQNSATTVARTCQESPACLNTCWWSMEPAVPQKYCKTDTWPSWWHAEGSALSSATSPSRLGSALRSTWRGVLICWHLDLKMSRAVCEGIHVVAGWDQCGRTKHMREKGFTPVMSVTRLSSLCKRLTSTQFGSTVAMCLSARVVGRSSRPTTASTDTRSFLVECLTTGRVFATSLCRARGGEEEKDCSVQLQEEGRHPLPSQLEIYYLVFNKTHLCNVYF